MRGVHFILSFILVVLLFASFVAAEDWTLQESGTTDTLHAVWFANEMDGWAVGSNIVYSAPIILHSADGGVSWEEQSSPVSQPLFDVCFSDRTHGWAVGQDTIIYTSNGGETWFDQSPSSSSSIAYKDISCVDAGSAYVVGSGGHILFTDDYGLTWTSVSSGESFDFYGSSFFDADHGYVTGDSSVILKKDGGAFTALDSVPLSFVDEIDCSSLDDCWIVGFGNIAYHTSDGGESWDGYDTGSYVVSLTSVSAQDADHVWVTGQSVLRSTEDGGSSWVHEDTEITDATTGLMDVAFMRDVMFVGGVGWAVGDEGTILRTGEVSPCPEVENTCIANDQPYAIEYDDVTGCVQAYDCVLLPEENHTLQAPRSCVDEYRDCLEEHWPRIDECDAWEFCEGIDDVLSDVEKEHVKDTFDSAGQYTYFQSFLDGEELNVYLMQDDGNVQSFGLSLVDGKFSIVKTYEKPTITVSLSQGTVSAIADAKDPKKAALDAVDNGDIAIKGIGFKSVKVFFLKAGLKVSLPFLK